MNKNQLNKPGKLILDVFWPHGSKHTIDLGELQDKLEHKFMEKVASAAECCDQHRVVHLDPFGEVA